MEEYKESYAVHISVKRDIIDITGIREGDIADFYVKCSDRTDILRKIDKYTELIKEEIEDYFNRIDE